MRYLLFSSVWNATAATGGNSHVSGGDTGEEKPREQYDSGTYGFISGDGYGAGYGGGRRRKSTGELGTGLDANKGLGGLLAARGYGVDGFDTGNGTGAGNGIGSGDEMRNNNKGAVYDHGGDIGVRSDSLLRGMGYGSGYGMMGGGMMGLGMMGGGRRRKRVSDGIGGGSGVESASVNSVMKNGGGYGIAGGWRHKRVAEGYRGGVDVGPGSHRTGIGYAPGGYRGGIGLRSGSGQSGMGGNGSSMFGGYGWAGKRRKRYPGRYGDGLVLRSGSLRSVLGYGDGMDGSGVRRHKRVADGDVIGDESESLHKDGGGYRIRGAGPGKRRKRCAGGFGGGIGVRSGTFRSDMGMSGGKSRHKLEQLVDRDSFMPGR